MKKIAVIFIFLYGCLLCKGADLSFSGSGFKVVQVSAEASTGLERIYVLHDLAGVSVSYTSQGDDVEWSTFGAAGGGSAQPVAGVSYNGNVSTLMTVEGDCGYIVKEGNRQYCFWVVDYSKHRFALNGVSFPSEQDCGTATLQIDGECDQITYYTINGVPKSLNRGIAIAYNTLEWNAENSMYESVEISKTYESLGERVVLTAPLCNTIFTVRGDMFEQEWGEEEVISTDTFSANSVEVQTTATQTQRDNSNEKKEEGTTDGLGGSAPVEVVFQSYCSDAVVFKEWQFARDSEFSNVYLRLNEESTTYTFRENGTFYVKFVGSNNDGTCTMESESYQVTVGESALECPNAFSPDATEGVNDEWKVSYKSIISFSCWIFDRYGTEIIRFTDPAMGWDGRYKGKFVKPGVYYYIIDATGADGKQYKLKGDINILKSSK